jgi:hypothetical protein
MYGPLRIDLAQLRRERRTFRDPLSRLVSSPARRVQTSPQHARSTRGEKSGLDDCGNDTQTWHVFGRIDDRLDNPNATLEHVCQINFAFDGLSDSVAGLFAGDDRGQVYVTHSGRVGGGTPGVGKDAFLAHLSEHSGDFRTADVTVASGRITPRLVLSNLDSRDFRRNIARFVDRVEAFKRDVRGLDTPDPPNPSSAARGQGREPDPEVRRAVEEHAMQVVEAHYRKQRYTVERTHTRRGELDLLCTRRGAQVRVEVKGTTTAGDSVELTAAELRRARAKDPPVDLAVVSGIEVDRTQSPPRAHGGELYIYRGFDPDEHTLEPTVFRCKLNHTTGQYA